MLPRVAVRYARVAVRCGAPSGAISLATGATLTSGGPSYLGWQIVRVYRAQAEQTFGPGVLDYLAVTADNTPGAQETAFPAVVVSHPEGQIIAALISGPPLEYLGDTINFKAPGVAAALAATRLGLHVRMAVVRDPVHVVQVRTHTRMCTPTSLRRHPRRSPRAPTHAMRCACARADARLGHAHG